MGKTVNEIYKELKTMNITIVGVPATNKQLRFLAIDLAIKHAFEDYNNESSTKTK